MLDLPSLRKEYTLAGLTESDLDPDPLRQFGKWLNQALEVVSEPNAMVLATVDSSGRPSARVVLLKAIDHRGFTFFTNYESRKGHELAQNPHAALVFYWAPLARQVCYTRRTSNI